MFAHLDFLEWKWMHSVCKEPCLHPPTWDLLYKFAISQFDGQFAERQIPPDIQDPNAEELPRYNTIHEHTAFAGREWKEEVKWVNPMLSMLFCLVVSYTGTTAPSRVISVEKWSLFWQSCGCRQEMWAFHSLFISSSIHRAQHLHTSPLLSYKFVR